MMHSVVSSQLMADYA